MLSKGKTTNKYTSEGLESRSVIVTLERVEADLQEGLNGVVAFTVNG